MSSQCPVNVHSMFIRCSFDVQRGEHTMSEIFNFTSTINPPTKNIPRVLGKHRYKNNAYHSPWNQIESQMYKTKFGITKEHFEAMHSEDKIKLQKTVSKADVILSLWNGFHRQDASNILTELQDRLQGIAYLNDRQVKECHIYKDDDSKKEYFKVIVELL